MKEILTVLGAAAVVTALLFGAAWFGPSPSPWIEFAAVAASGVVLTLLALLPLIDRLERREPDGAVATPITKPPSENGLSERLGALEGLCDSLVEQIPGPVMIVSADLRFALLNQQARTVFELVGVDPGVPFLKEMRRDPRFKGVARAATRVVKGRVSTAIVPADGLPVPEFQIDRLVFGDQVFARVWMPGFSGLSPNGKPDEAALQLVSELSHDLRTPLVAVRGFTEVLGRGSLGRLNPAQTRLVDTSMRNLDRLVAMIDKMLDLGKLNRQEERLRLETFDLLDLAQESVVLLEHEASQKGVDIALRKPAGLPELTVRADRLKVHRIVTNLLANARRFTPAGGRVRLDVRLASSEEKDELDTQLEVAHRRSGEFRLPVSYGDWVLIRVRDTGVGIPEDNLNRIFDRFFTIGNPEIGAPRGTGLGLAITDELVKLHNGVIQVATEVGKGTAFSVWLPISSALSAPIHLPASPAPPRDSEGVGAHILLVEDEPDIGEFARFVLEQEGHEVSVAPSKQAMWEVLDAGKPEMILLDCTLGDADGLDILRELKDQDAYRDVPIAIVSGQSAEAVRTQCTEAGGFGFLQKPFAIDDLNDFVHRGLLGRGPDEGRTGSVDDADALDPAAPVSEG